MSCDLTLGRLEQCLGNVGGIKAVYFVNYDEDLISGATVSGEEITALAGATPAFKYELKGDNNTFEETNEKSRENGTSFWNQSGAITLKVQDKTAQGELKLMSYGRPHVIVEDYNGNYRLAGALNGCDISVSTDTGGAMGDLNGYNITFEGKESGMSHFIESSIMGDVAGFVITEGV